MTVEMDKPFVWPADPESWEPWGKEEKAEQVRDMSRLGGVETLDDRREEARHLRKQVREMLVGKGKKAEAANAEGKELGETKPGIKKSLLELWEEKRTPQMLGRERESA